MMELLKNTNKKDENDGKKNNIFKRLLLKQPENQPNDSILKKDSLNSNIINTDTKKNKFPNKAKYENDLMKFSEIFGEEKSEEKIKNKQELENIDNKDKIENKFKELQRAQIPYNIIFFFDANQYREKDLCKKEVKKQKITLENLGVKENIGAEFFGEDKELNENNKENYDKFDDIIANKDAYKYKNISKKILKRKKFGDVKSDDEKEKNEDENKGKTVDKKVVEDDLDYDSDTSKPDGDCLIF